MSPICNFLLRGAAWAAATWLGLAGAAQAQVDTDVDVELVLAVDISVSMTESELEIQRDGYAAALTHPEVLRAITSGAYGKIAVTYFEWAGVTTQNVIVPWTVIAGQEDAERVAKQISVLPSWQPRRTSISGALNFGAGCWPQAPIAASSGSSTFPATAPTMRDRRWPKRGMPWSRGDNHQRVACDGWQGLEALRSGRSGRLFQRMRHGWTGSLRPAGRRLGTIS